MKLPKFRQQLLPAKEGLHSDDYATGVYIGQLNHNTGKKEGLGVRLYLTDKLTEQDRKEGIPLDKIISLYEGEWMEDKRQGTGYEVYKNKDVYVGSFVEN